MSETMMQVRINDSKPMILRDRGEWLDALAIIGNLVPAYDLDELKTRGNVSWDVSQALATGSRYGFGLQFADIDILLRLEPAELTRDAEYAFEELP